MTAPDFTVVAVRYCTDVPAVAAFYETLGLSRRISTPTGGFVTLVAGDGLVMLHDAGDALTGVRAGLVELSLEVSDLDAAADRLAELGLETVRWDESYGQHLGLRDPHGDGIWINEVQRDLYGYREHDASPNDLNLLAIRYTGDFGTDAEFFGPLGFHARTNASEHFTPLEGSAPARGVIGLHPPGASTPTGPHATDNPVAPPLLIEISFETHEPLVELAARLGALGIASALEGGPAPNVRITDPEGVEVEIHIAP